MIIARCPTRAPRSPSVGARPAGLLLGHLLHRAGSDSVIVGNRSETHVVERVRAGVLESTCCTRSVSASVSRAKGRGTRASRSLAKHYTGFPPG